ncbi:hypothetical protein [uncultured Gilliamella sp.]|uniref:hypothetical protein n=1 Tax=uncultured Gilliamella sp. TaxID=1193505 RepID=UPI0026002520|nr:hypothetical protein [uncultured Gilliamella sp.]
MKYLTIKKIAFGLFLAVYATNSVFAAQTATASKAIQGNAPVLRWEAGKTDHTVNVVIGSDAAGTSINEARNLKVGDYIVIKYDLYDVDGDLDNGTVAPTLKVFVKKPGETAWSAQRVTAETADGRISFKITDDFAGVTKIGFQLLETTQYGDPAVNQWLAVTDIWESTAPKQVAYDKNDETNHGALTDLGDDLHGPGHQDFGSITKGPVESSNVKIGIFKYDTRSNALADPLVDYSRSSTAIPKYGDVFKAIVWLEDNRGTTDKYDLNIDTDLSSNYKYEWKLTGTYQTVAAVDVALTSAQGVSTSQGAPTDSNDLIRLGVEQPSSSSKHNNMYPSDYKAGAQGYKLKVSTK